MFNYLLYLIKKTKGKSLYLNISENDLINLDLLQKKIYFSLEPNIYYHGVVILRTDSMIVERWSFLYENTIDMCSSDIDDIRALIEFVKDRYPEIDIFDIQLEFVKK